MQHNFKVTGLGLTIDKVMIMPGSELTLSAPAPGHWRRFGEASQADEKQMMVATPTAGNDGGGKSPATVGVDATKPAPPKK